MQEYARAVESMLAAFEPLPLAFAACATYSQSADNMNINWPASTADESAAGSAAGSEQHLQLFNTLLRAAGVLAVLFVHGRDVLVLAAQLLARLSQQHAHEPRSSKSERDRDREGEGKQMQVQMHVHEAFSNWTQVFFHHFDSEKAAFLDFSAATLQKLIPAAASMIIDYTCTSVYTYVHKYMYCTLYI